MACPELGKKTTNGMLLKPIGYGFSGGQKNLKVLNGIQLGHSVGSLTDIYRKTSSV